jgi:hypothetical protein
VGDLSSRDISKRCRVWAEPGIVDAVAYEFAETEEFLKTAEEVRKREGEGRGGERNIKRRRRTLTDGALFET